MSQKNASPVPYSRASRAQRDLADMDLHGATARKYNRAPLGQGKRPKDHFL